MIRFGLVGCGTHAKWAVIPAIRAATGCELVAVTDINAANLASVEGDGLGRYTDYKTMLAEAKLDAVYIATLSDTHTPIGLAAMARGLHVVCEKPMATTVPECEELAAAVERTGVTFAVNFETRYSSWARKVRQWIKEERLGRIEAIHVQHFWDGHKVYGPIGERRKRLTDLSGALDCGIHKADIIRHFCGGEWTHVHARGRWFIEDVKLAPHISILAELDNGIMATLNVSFAYGAYMPPKAYSDVLTIVGTDGVINHFEEHMGPTTVNLTSKTLTESFPATEPGHATVMTDFLTDFAATVEGRMTDTPMATAADGLMAQILVDQANSQALAHRVEKPIGKKGA